MRLRMIFNSKNYTLSLLTLLLLAVPWPCRAQSIWSWGKNNVGQIADGRTADVTQPYMAAGDGWETLAAGAYMQDALSGINYSRTMAIRKDGTLWGWGDNRYGQMGTGATSGSGLFLFYIEPVQVGADADWKAIAVGGKHTVAVKTDGTLWSWGVNDRGQVGDGTNTDKILPAKIGSATNWSAVAAGKEHTIALRSDGSLWGWGMNFNGQLGDGTKISANIPVQIGTGYELIAAAGNHSAAIKADGSLWCWGEDTLAPGRASMDNDWSAIATGEGHILALKTNGSLWSWERGYGGSSRGQLGDRPATGTKQPAQVGAASDWKLIAAGGRHSLAVKQNGTLWAWGEQKEGQLGNNNTSNTNVTVPVQVGTESDWLAITAAGGHSAGIRVVPGSGGGTRIADPEPSAGILMVYPNPAGSYLNIELKEGTADRFRITDITGRTIIEEAAGGSSVIRVVTDGLTPGMYLYEVLSGEGGKTCGSFVKE